MPSKSSLTLSVASAAVAALFAGGAYAVTATSSEPEAQPTTSVVNKTGHEVNENAADGQDRATEARSTGETKRAEKQAERDARKAEQKAERDARKAEQKAERDARKAEQKAERDARKAEQEAENDADDTDDTSDAAEAESTGPKQGPNEKAGDKPNENAFAHPGDRSAQGPKDRRGPNENAGDHPNDNASKDRSNQREERDAESDKK